VAGNNCVISWQRVPYPRTSAIGCLISSVLYLPFQTAAREVTNTYGSSRNWNTSRMVTAPQNRKKTRRPRQRKWGGGIQSTNFNVKVFSSATKNCNQTQYLLAVFLLDTFAYTSPSARNTLHEDLRAVADHGLFRKQLKTDFQFGVWCLLTILMTM